MRGKEQGTNEDALNETTMKTSIVFESISRSSVLVKLTLSDVLFGDDCPLEGFLSSTRTLLELNYLQGYSTMTHQVAQAIGSGLAKNKSLVDILWIANIPVGADFLEEILFGLYDHISLKCLRLEVQLTKSSSLALRSLLHFNGTLESLAVKARKDAEMIPTMLAVLAGLAQNTGLKALSLETDSNETNAILATAWTNMLQRNTSIIKLDSWKTAGAENGDADCEMSSAVAKGLVENSTLETLHFSYAENLVLHGPVWQEALESNHCLKKLSLSNYSVSLEAFQCLAQGLSRNTSLESIDLSCTEMTDTSVIALVDGLRTNKTLKCLNLFGNRGLSQSGRAAIERLIGYSVLSDLDLARTMNSVGASILNSGLFENNSLEKLELQRAFVESEGSETFRALCGSLR